MIHLERKDSLADFLIVAGLVNHMPQISSLMSDRRNIALIHALQADPRQPVTKLATTVGMSAPAVKER